MRSRACADSTRPIAGRSSWSPTAGATTAARHWQGSWRHAGTPGSRWSPCGPAITSSSAGRDRRGGLTRTGSQVVNGTAFARCEYAFLHDADAFFLEADGLERQFLECRDRGAVHAGRHPPLGPLLRGDRLCDPGDLGDDVLDPMGPEPTAGRTQGGDAGPRPRASRNSTPCSTPSSWTTPRAGSA